MGACIWSTAGELISELAEALYYVDEVRELGEGQIFFLGHDEEYNNKQCLWSSDRKSIRLIDLFSVDRNIRYLSSGKFINFGSRWGYNGFIQFWSGDGELIRTLEGHHSHIAGVRELSNGHILSWGANDPLRLWSPDGEKLSVFHEQCEDVYHTIELSSGRVLSLSASGTLRLWSVDGQAIGILECDLGSVDGVMELASGRILAWSEEGNHRLWNKNGKPLMAMKDNWNVTTGVAARGRYLYDALELANGSIFTFWSVGTCLLSSAKMRKEYRHEKNWQSIFGAVMLIGGSVLSWEENGTLRLWAADGNLVGVLETTRLHASSTTECANDEYPLRAKFQPHFISNLTGNNTINFRDFRHEFRYIFSISSVCTLSLGWDRAICIWSDAGDYVCTLDGLHFGVGERLEISDLNYVSFTNYDHYVWHSDGFPVSYLWESDGDLVGPLEKHWNGFKRACEFLAYHMEKDRGQRGRGESFIFGAVQLTKDRIVSLGTRGIELWNAEGNLIRILQEGTYGDDFRIWPLSHGRVLSWNQGAIDGTIRIWGSDGSPLMMWVRPNGIIKLVIPNEVESNTFWVLVDGDLLQLEIRD